MSLGTADVVVWALAGVVEFGRTRKTEESISKARAISSNFLVSDLFIFSPYWVHFLFYEG
jgi:hypothetical protein